MVEVYCARIENFTSSESKDLLEEQELFHFLQELMGELTFVLELPFVKFWAYIIKNTQVISFLDSFLMNMRK